MNDPSATIVAPATPTGGALCVIHVSGPEAITLCDSLFRGRHRLADTPSHTARYGTIRDGEEVVDEVVATLFRAPHSYTGEESVELSCHGSRYIVQRIVELLVGRGARMAEPGEFTARAFLAGRLDLSQAEAVADMIAASSRATHALAATQLRGGYSADLEGLRGELLRLTSLLELELDFSEEEVEFADRTALRDTMHRIGTRIDALVRSFSLGNALKEGVAVAIVGRPNAGKSTLLNRLLNEERALVSEIPGTTRDVIEECVTLDGVTFRFIDTAGLRATDDRIERLGIARTHASIERAQIVLQLVEASDETFEPLALRDDQRLLIVENKIDRFPAHIPGAIPLSARSGEGIDRLVEALRQSVDTSTLWQGETIVSNVRHYEALRRAGKALDEAVRGLDDGLPADLLSEEIRQVIYHLGTITGQITNDEVLGEIFSKFCVGK